MKVDVIVYLACSMTGRNKKEMYEESLNAIKVLESRGITVLSPVMEEGVKPDNETLIPISREELDGQWNNDKKLIRRSHVLLDLTGPMKSEGVTHEIGYARFGLFMPVVRVYPGLGHSVARLEDDGIVSSIEEAADLIANRWGSRPQRIVWRLFERRFLTKWPLLVWRQLKGLFR